MQANKKMNNPVITLETISPHTAAEMLKGNTVNRRLVFNLVDRLASEMSAGEWKVTGDTIKFNGDRLLDGQHRLEAIVRSGVTVQSFVARSVDSDAFPVLDTGRTRMGSDVLSAHGYRNVFITASTARMVWFFERKMASLNETITNSAVLNLCKRHPELPSFISDVHCYRFAKTSGVVASLYWVWLSDRTKGDEFLAQFLKGIELKVTNPVYVLRERLINDHQLRSTKQGRRALIAAVFRTWDAWLTGKTVGHLKATQPSSADFPWPKGAPYLV